ncbi:MAG: bifunctional 4-hydroxy-2-oxoglutarate aldolase/2-dehydro-3-deoxy-phosphogluconate aldolase [Cyclobacteriaceae bacterium]
MSGNYSQQKFDEMPIVGIMRNLSSETVDRIVPIYQEAGLTNLEITMNSPNVSEVIEKLSSDFPDLNIGAGTVCNTKDLDKALAAGASFIVTPIMDLEVMRYCLDNEVPIFPGAFTPLEIYTAWKQGASAVKIFPATQLGPVYVKDVLAPLNDIKLLPTGGVSIDNIQDFMKAGAVGAGMGSTLFDKELIAAANFDGLLKHFQNMVATVKEVM